MTREERELGSFIVSTLIVVESLKISRLSRYWNRSTSISCIRGLPNLICRKRGRSGRVIAFHSVRSTTVEKLATFKSGARKTLYSNFIKEKVSTSIARHPLHRFLAERLVTLKNRTSLEISSFDSMLSWTFSRLIKARVKFSLWDETRRRLRINKGHDMWPRTRVFTMCDIMCTL